MRRAAIWLVLIAALPLLGYWLLVPASVATAPPASVQRPPVATEPAPVQPPLPAPSPAPLPADRTPPTPVRVLYVEDSARWEFVYLSNVLTREPSFVARVCLTDPSTLLMANPPLPMIAAATAFASSESLAEYDVVILGDVSADSLGSSSALTLLRDFVTRGGGLVLLAGARSMPSKVAGTPLEELLPVRLGGGVELVADPVKGFAFHVTEDGAKCAFIDVAGDRVASKLKWETDMNWRQYWVFPARDARPGARVLLEASSIGGDPQQRVPAVVSSTYGSGRVLFVGVDELWRIRSGVGDPYHGGFWKGAVRWLASAPR